MILFTEGVFILLLHCCCCLMVNARCWLDCPESQIGLSEPQCFLKDNGIVASCHKYISNSDLSTQSISSYNHVTVSLDVSTRLVSLHIDNEIGAKLTLGASQYNYQITQLVIQDGGSAYIRPDLFQLLPNLKHLYLGSIVLHYFPHFSHSNQFLTHIYVGNFIFRAINENTIRNGNVNLPHLKYLYLYPRKDTNLTDQTFSGLTALTYLGLGHIHIPNPVATFSPLVRLKQFRYEASGLTDISFLKQTPSLNRLEFLSFSFNSIASIQSNTFSNYGFLTKLYLYYNKISRLENECFNGLRKLNGLTLHGNQLRELNENTFKGLEYVAWIELSGNYISRLTSRMFEYLPYLSRIYSYGLPLHCDSGLQWISKVNIFYLFPRCASPPQHYGKLATDRSIYANYTQDLSYQCFNRSVHCPSGSYCQDTLHSHTCVCDEERHIYVQPLNKCISYDELAILQPRHTSNSTSTVSLPPTPSPTQPYTGCIPIV